MAERAAPARLGIADLHVHTALSDGTASPEEVVRWADARTDLDLLAVTDHDDIRGAWAVREAAARCGTRLEVIVGTEVTTRSGHLLALFLVKPVPSLRSLAATLDAVHAQGGLCLIPHPLSPLTAAIGRRALERLRTSASSASPIDGIELANPTPAARLRQGLARRLNRERWRLAETGGSDAHFVEAIGSAVTRFPGRSTADLRRALAAGLTVAEERWSPSLREVGLGRLLRQQVRALGATPRALLRPAQRRPARRPLP